MKLKRGGGKRLGGKPPRRPGRRSQPARPEGRSRGTMLWSLAAALFVIGLVMGYGAGVDRQIQRGVLRQRQEARRRPDWVPVRALPRYVPAAFVAVIEPPLLEQGALRPPEHGTTVARELVHQVHMLPASMPGHAQELVMGPVLAKRLAPDALVELYLNRVALGRNQGAPVYGIWHAAQEYFGKDPRQLTLGETATLAGLLLAPRIDDPKTHVGGVGERRNEVLRVMQMGGLISEEEYRAAAAEPLGLQPGLEQLPMSRPADWGSSPTALRLPPNLRPVPRDSTKKEESAR